MTCHVNPVIDDGLIVVILFVNAVHRFPLVKVVIVFVMIVYILACIQDHVLLTLSVG